jgi:tetratricopeptide (TPR) repeat protein
MPEDADLHFFEIAIEDFDLNLIPAGARAPGSKAFEAAVKSFYEDQLRKTADSYSVMVEHGKIRVTWRKAGVCPDPFDDAVAALKNSDYKRGVEILEMLLPSRDHDPMVHFNLGMAYSDQGKLDEAIKHLERARALEPGLVNAAVALGVAHARQNRYDDAAQVLKDAVLRDPDNGYALRNLGAVLMQLGRDKADALRYLRRATELLPKDQQAWFGLGQAQLDTGDSDAADESLRRVIDLQPQSPIADMARQLRSRIAEENYRESTTGGQRTDAVLYCLAALKKFAEMTPEEVQKVGFEIATLGMSGIDVNDPAPKYHLRTLPGPFSGSQLLCYEFVAFKQIAPHIDIGFDVSKEYEEAKRMMVQEQ